MAVAATPRDAVAVRPAISVLVRGNVFMVAVRVGDKRNFVGVRVRVSESVGLRYVASIFSA